MKRTGYYFPSDGPLRHAHYINDSSTPVWHVASSVHLDFPTVHGQWDVYDPNLAAWAKSNQNLTSTEKAILVGEAKELHDAAEKDSR